MTFWYWLLSWLPFEWAAPDTMLFMKNALLAVLVVTPLFGLLSTMVVESRMAFFSDALGHSAFTGMAIGALCGLTRPVGAAVVFAVVIALLFTLVRQKTHMASDTAISVFSSAAVALGIFLSTLGGQSFTKFNTLLIGDILSVAPAEIGLLALILLALVILWLTSYNQMMLSSVHQALADSRGIQVVWKNFLFTAAIAVVVTISGPGWACWSSTPCWSCPAQRPGTWRKICRSTTSSPSWAASSAASRASWCRTT